MYEFLNIKLHLCRFFEANTGTRCQKIIKCEKNITTYRQNIYMIFLNNCLRKNNVYLLMWIESHSIVIHEIHSTL